MTATQKALQYPVFRETRSEVILSNDDYVFHFDKTIAQITKWSIHGSDMLDGPSGPRLTFWRPPTDNDIPHDAEVWALFGLDSMQQQVRSVSCGLQSSGILQIVVTSWISPPILAWGFDTTTTYTVHGDGDVQIHVHAEPRGSAPKTLPRFGLEMELSKSTTDVKWFGRGPGESYSDKKEAARFGIWSKSVDDMMINYEFPQENGNRTDTKWVQLANERGSGLRAVLHCEEPANANGFDFNVQRFSAKELQKAKHPYELGSSEKVLFRIDGGHNGLGTASCGPGTLEKYQLACQTLDFTVDLAGLRS